MLTFDQVHFYYKKSQPVLEDISFTIEAGSLWRLLARMALANPPLQSSWTDCYCREKGCTV